MNRRDDLATISTDQRRLELVKLLAAAVIRVMERKRNGQVDAENPGKTSADGLEDS
jgi:hypothetical protein